jgi:hypothetical protein
VDVEEGHVLQAGGEDRGRIAARGVGRDVQVAEVEQHAGGGRVQAADEVAHRDRVVAAARRAGVHRGEVLDRHGDAKGMRPLEERDEGSLLELGALAQARGRRAVCLHEVEAVVGDELGARLRGVVHETLECPIVLGRAGAQVVRGVEHEAQAAVGELVAQRPRVAQAVTAVGEHRPRRRVDLDPAEPGRHVRGEHGRGRPGVAVDVQAQALVHRGSASPRRRSRVLPGRDHAMKGR